ncbi:hypothetical protein GCM10009843_03600 [Nocardioides bigeumensis]|uniref:YCII-related domain-containing protein n=2 Tax=Nocardioides bigeumensis TaxID=433657 RepID=A0ABP5JAE5_9ACTN
MYVPSTVSPNPLSIALSQGAALLATPLPDDSGLIVQYEEDGDSTRRNYAGRAGIAVGRLGWTGGNDRSIRCAAECVVPVGAYDDVEGVFVVEDPEALAAWIGCEILELDEQLIDRSPRFEARRAGAVRVMPNRPPRPDA